MEKLFSLSIKSVVQVEPSFLNFGGKFYKNISFAEDAVGDFYLKYGDKEIKIDRECAKDLYDGMGEVILHIRKEDKKRKEK